MSRLLPLALLAATLTTACAGPPAALPAPEAIPQPQPPPTATIADGPSTEPGVQGVVLPSGLVAVPRGIDCDRPIEAQLCPDGGAACRDNQLKVNHYLGRWHLRCEPLTPADPIAGERVGAIVAGKPEALPLTRDPAVCSDPARNHAPVVTRRQEGARTVFEVSSNRDAACRGGADSYPVTLGMLEAGAYEVRSEHGRQRFTVRPRGSDPGTFDSDTILRFRIAQAHHIQQCDGDPLCNGGPFVGPDFEATRASNRLKRLFPNVPQPEREQIFSTARAVFLHETGPGAWTYEFTSKGLCGSSHHRGQVTQQPDGSFIIGDPVMLSHQLIPC
jgi:hypothetical protein